jgi:hypothetical protein
LVLCAAHVPCPSQAKVSAVPFVQVGEPQAFPEAGYVHWARFWLLQVPAQLLPSLPHAGRFPWGLPSMPTHVPGVAALHASHCPVQAVSQHTPSTQKPDWHSSFTEHCVPCAAGVTHWPVAVTHALPEPQSASAVQPVPHAPAVHVYGEQSPSGSVRSATAPHSPLLPAPFAALLQDWHAPLHAVSQQKPSTQLPVWHTPQPVLKQSPPADLSHKEPWTFFGLQVWSAAQ